MKQSLLSGSWINESDKKIETGEMKESLFSGSCINEKNIA